MIESSSLGDRYLALIDGIVEITLKGQIRSKEQVYQMLVQAVSVGTGEIFERSLSDRLTATQEQVKTQKDELKLAKANRTLRAIQTIQGEYQRWQQENRTSEAIAAAVQQIITAESPTTALLRVIDQNRPDVFTLEQFQQLATALKQAEANPDFDQPPEVPQLVLGITRGLESWQRLEGHLVSWIYEQNREQLGFGGISEQRGPWAVWAKQVNSPFPRQVFQTLARSQSLIELAANQQGLELSALVELAVILQCLQRGLVEWFDKLVYDSKVGAKLSISTFLTFAAVWCLLASGFNQTSLGRDYADGCFQVTLQILRAFAQREYFPLYGGIFASFSGEYLRNTLQYFDEPLRRVEGTQEKARILTLLGYSLRAEGRYDQAKSFHEQALEIAREAGDTRCEIANFNYLSRACVAQKNYAEAINYSQRALILARQTGDKLGEANALANLGYSEVLQAQELERMDEEFYESAIAYLEQGTELSQRLGDRQSQALCLSSLGIAKVILAQPQAAIAYLEDSLKAAQFSGDLYLQGLNLAYIAEAYYAINNVGQAISTGCLAMYLLDQIMAKEWRQPAGLLTIL